jgi:hypothetical protein
MPQCLQQREEKFKDTKEVIRIRKSKDRQHNGQKKKGGNYKQRSTKHYTDNKLSSNSNHTENRGELRCSSKVSSSCFNRGTRRATLVTNLVIRHKWGKGKEVLTTSGTYRWSFVTHIIFFG